jgi:hypothetical protein
VTAPWRRAARHLLTGLMWLGYGFWPVPPVLDPDEQQWMPPGGGVFSRWP